MYDKSYQGKTRPFSAAANLWHYFPTSAAEIALRHAKACLDRQSGPVLILGPAGTGKTLMLDLLADAYSNIYQVAHLACARNDTRRDVLQGILFQLGQSYRELTESELRLELLDYLRPGPHCSNGVLLLVDDAHCLEASILDELRVLSGIIRGGQHRCLLVLAANPSLDERLAEADQESLNQRIGARCYLAPFNQAETVEYVHRQLKLIPGTRVQFGSDALSCIYRCTQGVPRLINQLCEAAVDYGAGIVSAGLIQATWAELQRFPSTLLDAERFEPGLSTAVGRRFTDTPTPANSLEFGVLQDDLAEPAIDSPSLGLSASVEIDDEDCEGRLKPESNVFEKAKLPFMERVMTEQSHWRGSAPKSTAESTLHAEAEAIADLDPDFPNREPEPRTPIKTTSQPNNPFEEVFETEEVISDRYFQATAGHNRSATALTRPILDEYQLDQIAAAVGAIAPTPVLAIREADNAVSLAPPRIQPEIPSSPTSTLPLHVANDLDLSLTEFTRTADDRDVLIVSQANQQPYNRVDRVTVESEMPQRPLSTGKAIRMDYKQLFARLRQGQLENRNSR